MKDVNVIVNSSISLLFLYLAYKLYTNSKSKHKNLPPSPPNSLPIIGHLHLLKPPVHRVFHSLFQKYGPIISLKFGSQLTVVVSSSSAVEECFTKNDIVLANRPKTLVSQHLAYNNSTIAFAPYGDHWRNIRRIGSIEIFSTHRINMFLGMRKDETMRLVKRLSRDSLLGFAKVEMKSLFSDFTFNVIMRMVAGKRYYGEDVSDMEEARQFKELIEDIFRHSGASHPEDYFPVLNWVHGFEKKIKRISKRADKFLQGLIDERRSMEPNNTEDKDTMLDHLLSLQKSQPEYYSDDIIKGLIQTILLAGTDTSAVTSEWALSNLVNHPDILEKARRELDSEVGQDRLLNESDIPKLHYLHNIIQETLRLYPAAPLLVPHCSSNDCTIGGYNMPRGATVLVNAWAIHRDPTIWEESTRFNPERFDHGKIDAHKLIPFGLGRRACPGASLAQRVVSLTLGTLIQCFGWQRIGEMEVDMTEGEGISMPKLEPLEVLCKARPIVAKVFPASA